MKVSFPLLGFNWQGLSVGEVVLGSERSAMGEASGVEGFGACGCLSSSILAVLAYLV